MPDVFVGGNHPGFKSETWGAPREGHGYEPKGKRPASESGPYNGALILMDLQGGRSGGAPLRTAGKPAATKATPTSSRWR